MDTTRITQLIAMLQEIQNKHGDIPVYTYNHEFQHPAEIDCDVITVQDDNDNFSPYVVIKEWN